jgi:hypothetical protein
MDTDTMAAMATYGLTPKLRGVLNPSSVGSEQNDPYYTNGGISRFGVGSKQGIEDYVFVVATDPFLAAFYIGDRFTIISKTKDSPMVHELSISAKELNRRYSAGESVYTDRISSRNLASLPQSVLSSLGFKGKWIRQVILAESLLSHFTLILISDLKESAGVSLSSFCVNDVARNLGQIYHYYTEANNMSISLASFRSDQKLFEKNLKDVEDLESLKEKIAESEIQFVMEPHSSSGSVRRVAGRLFYFPNLFGNETLERIIEHDDTMKESVRTSAALLTC